MGYRRSSVPNLYWDERTGIYYVRTKVHGRTIWKTLQTNEFRVAKLRAPKELGDLQKGRNALSSLERVPWETLIKLFRSTNSGSRETVADYGQAFLDFLIT